MTILLNSKKQGKDKRKNFDLLLQKEKGGLMALRGEPTVFMTIRIPISLKKRLDKLKYQQKSITKTHSIIYCLEKGLLNLEKRYLDQS